MKQIILLALIISNLTVAFAQDKYSTIDINETQDFSDFDKFFSNSELDQYKIYFTGENHQFGKVNSSFEFKFLTYLNKNQNVNHFLFEQSPAIGYIMTGITIDNNSRFKSYLKEKYSTHFYELVMDVKRYNTKIDSNNRIRVHGIDVERFPAFSIFALNDIIDSLSVDGETGLIYESIQALVTSEFIDASPDEIYNGGGMGVNLTGDPVDAWKTFETIIFESEKHKKELEKELGDKYEIYSQIIESVSKGHEWYVSEREGDLSAPVTRERFMYSQFLKVHAKYPESKFYGQFGRCHLHADKKAKRCYSHDLKSIASRINTSSDSTLAGKVLAIPVYYREAQNFDEKIIESLKLDERFTEGNKIYLIDLEYLNNDNPLVGFGETLPFAILNTYKKNNDELAYDFGYTLTEYHLGVYHGRIFFNKLDKLNFELDKIGVPGFTNKFETYSVVFDYIAMNETGVHFGFNYMPAVSNNDRFSLKGYTFSYGGNYPFGNEYLMAAIGVNMSYGNMTLLEEGVDGSVSNLIQKNGNNLTAYKNDIFTLDPNLDLRLTLPVISINGRIGYGFDLSGKYWKLDGKMKNFTKTSFSAPYIQLGLSLNLKEK